MHYSVNAVLGSMQLQTYRGLLVESSESVCIQE